MNIRFLISVCGMAITMAAVVAGAAVPSAGLPDFAEVGPEAYRPLRGPLAALATGSHRTPPA